MTQLFRTLTGYNKLWISPWLKNIFRISILQFWQWQMHQNKLKIIRWKTVIFPVLKMWIIFQVPNWFAATYFRSMQGKFSNKFYCDRFSVANQSAKYQFASQSKYSIEFHDWNYCGKRIHNVQYSANESHRVLLSWIRTITYNFKSWFHGYFWQINFLSFRCIESPIYH